MRLFSIDFTALFDLLALSDLDANHVIIFLPPMTTLPPLEFGTQMPLRNEGRVIGEKDSRRIERKKLVVA